MLFHPSRILGILGPGKEGVQSAQAQMASVEEERTKDEGHKRMSDFLSMVATHSTQEDFLNDQAKEGEAPVSLDSLKTENGWKRVEEMLTARNLLFHPFRILVTLGPGNKRCQAFNPILPTQIVDFQCS